MNVDTNGGVFGEGLGSVLPPNINDEGFEDLGGPPTNSGPYASPVQMPPPMPTMTARRAPMPRPMPGYPIMGMGQEMALPATAEAPASCSKVGTALVGFLAGGLTVGLAWGAHYYFTRRS